MATHSRILVWRVFMDRGAWRATVYSIAEGQIRLKWLSMHTPSHLILETALWGRSYYACFYTGRNWCSKKLNVFSKVKELVSNRPRCLRSRGLFLVAMKSPISSHVDWSWTSTQACKSTLSALWQAGGGVCWGGDFSSWLCPLPAPWPRTDCLPSWSLHALICQKIL